MALSPLKTRRLLNSNVAKFVFATPITGILPAEAMGTQEDQYIFPPIPNFIFTRDIGIMVKDHILLSRMATVARRRESLLTKFLSLYYFFKDEPQKVMEIIEESDFFLYEEEERKHRIITIEGGDVMMIHPKHFVIGCSIRTSSSAVNEMVHTLFSKPELGIEKVVGRAMKENIGSIKVLEKIGMKFKEKFDFEGREGLIYEQTNKK